MERRAFERRSIVAKNDMPFDDQSELQVGASVYDHWSGATRQRQGADMVF
jgi:hypothetical protein